MRALFALVTATLLFAPCAHAQLADVAQSHIDANVPAEKDFRPFLIRDLTAHLRPKFGDGISVDYELLRDGATQTGIAYPKFYVWVKLASSSGSVVEGVARAAAIAKREFQITDFLTREVILAQPSAVDGVFPEALLGKIRQRAGLSQ
jgi:hypothetical protein